MEEINKAKIELANISERMKTNDEKWVVPEHVRIWARSLKKTLEAFNPELNAVKQPKVMKNETITIESPEGQVFDLENSTPTHLKLKKVEPKKRPMSFEEIERIDGAYVADNATIGFVSNYRSISKVKNVWPTKGLAEAALALSQLLQLRDAWNECNTEDVVEGIVWYGITNQNGKAVGMGSNYINMPLRFKTEETRDAFLKQFRPLIETALPLL